MLKALARSMKTTPRGGCSFFAFLIRSCSNFRFSAHPDDLINPLCRGLMGHALVNLAVRILENNLKIVDLVVIGHQLLMSFWCSSKDDFDTNTVQHSFTMSSTIPGTDDRLNNSIN